MAIKAYFGTNQNAITVSGLYQWDYGQTLEIECAELGTETGVEVHFACDKMIEAIVRSCNFSDGVGTVVIPNICLEQTGNITAWIYKTAIDEMGTFTQGHTIKTITLPITARIRPSASREVPADYIDKYAEALAAINAAIEKLENGTVKVKNAVSATQATNANHATTTTRVMISEDTPVVSLEVQELGEYSVELDVMGKGVYLAILTLEGDYEGVPSIYSGVGYIGGNAKEGEWVSYEIAVGRKFIYIDHDGDYSYKTIRINTEGNKGEDYGNAGTLKLYRIAGFSVG